MELAVLKKADLQDRALRKWELYNSMMRSSCTEDRVSSFGTYGMDSGPWSDLDFPVTPKAFKFFLCWLATPSPEKNPHSESESTRAPHEVAFASRGHSFTYTRVLAYSLLAFVEDNEAVEGQLGKFVDGGDVSVLRREQELAMKSIAL